MEMNNPPQINFRLIGSVRYPNKTKGHWQNKMKSSNNARNTAIFYVSPKGTYKENLFTRKDGTVVKLSPQFNFTHAKIEEDNEYSFIMESAEETTSPVGVMNKLHIRHEDYSCRYGRLNSVNNNEGLYEVWHWGTSGSKATFCESFETEEDAEDFVFTQTYLYDFQKDDQRNTCYHFTKEDAEQELIELYASEYGTSKDVAESIYNRQILIARLKSERDEKWKKEEQERVKKLVEIYSAMIGKAEGESYKETAKRLSDAVGSRIESKIFHLAVKEIRK